MSMSLLVNSYLNFVFFIIFMYGRRAPKGELCNKVCMYVCMYVCLSTNLNYSSFFQEISAFSGYISIWLMRTQEMKESLPAKSNL